MDAEECLRTRRSVRGYSQRPIPVQTLREIADVARFAPSGGNRQGWEMVLVCEPGVVAQVYETLSWLPAVGAPPQGRRPVAYMVVVSRGTPVVADCASLVSYVLLAARARGVGTCWFGSIDRDRLAQVLGIPDDYGTAFVVSLGFPDEKLETCDSDSETQVTVRDGVVRVPKLALQRIVHENSFTA